MKKVEKRDQEYIKQKNKSMIMDIIRDKRPISRADIAKMTGMSPTSVGRIVGELCELGLVKETEPHSNGVGRKAILLDINTQSVLTVGVYLDKDIIRTGILDFEGHIVALNEIKFDCRGTDPQLVAQKIAEEVRESISNNKIPISKIIGIGIGMPGIIDFKRGVVVFSAQLGWKNINIINMLEKEIAIKTTVDNAEKVKVLAESLYGAAKGSNNVVLISLGSGVGSASIINGEIFRSKNNSVGEIGHTTVDPNGIMCDCGRRGCLQTYIAEGALIQEANKVKDITSIRQIIDAADNKENWAVSILDRATTYIAIAINNLVCMYNPDTVILSGKLIEKYPEIKELIEQKCDQYIWEQFNGAFKIVYSMLKNQSVIIGAATLALNTYLDLN